MNPPNHLSSSGNRHSPGFLGTVIRCWNDFWGFRNYIDLHPVACSIILGEIAEADFDLLTDLANVARPLASLEPKSSLESLLLTNEIKNQFRSRESEVLFTHGIHDPLAFGRTCQRLARQDVGIAQLIEETEKMFQDALTGQLPLLPEACNATPKASKSEVLQFLATLHNQQRRDTIKILRNTVAQEGYSECSHWLRPKHEGTRRTMRPPREVANHIAATMRATEMGLLALHATAMGTRSQFMNTVARYSRDEEFVRQLKLLKDLHNVELLRDVDDLAAELEAATGSTMSPVIAAA